ncbi:MAG: PHP domain-containing protein [Planctomycetota bacterium]|jgi:hypothetical protein
MTSEAQRDLTRQLDSFDAAERRAALERLADPVGPEAARPERPEVNLHCHTFFSYNAHGFSPSRFAWEASRYGLRVAGIVDFDVLDGVGEFLEAGRLLSLRAVAGLETRVFVEEYADRVTNSPHEPGVAYLVATGFAGPPAPGTDSAGTLPRMAELAERRNRGMLRRINEHLAPVSVDYEADVLPLTPAGNATERHMLLALERRGREAFPDRTERAEFWSEKLGEPLQNVRRLFEDSVAFRTLMRYRLMKHGGVGYVSPERGSFPRLEEVVGMALACGAVPSGAWLDGTNEGEKDPDELFRFWLGKGIPTVTVIPERNWNVADPDERAAKIENLRAALDAAERLEMPVLVGTEMNAEGQRFVDAFSAPELEPHRQLFLEGGHFAWAHTLLRTTAGVGAAGPWAELHFGGERARRNAFFQRIGRLPYPDGQKLHALRQLGEGAEPEEFLRVLEC